MSSVDDSPPGSPTPAAGLSGTGSASRLVLLPDTDDHDPLQEYVTDDENEDEDEEPQPGVSQLPVPPLSPSVVFLYLLSPYLRLGAMYASDIGDAPVTYGLAGLAIVASLSVFCRQIWFLLGRYLRRSSTEDILVHMFARGHRRVRKYGWARHIFGVISGSFRLLLAAMYLRDSVDTALLLQLPEWIPFHSRFNISVLLFILVFVLSLPKSLAAKSVVYTTALSVTSYLAWLIATSRSYGVSEHSVRTLSLSQRGVLWNEISSLTFAFTTATTVPLSASLMVGTPVVPLASRNARVRSFELLNAFSTILATLFVFPLVIMAAAPRAPASAATSDNLILGLRIVTLTLSIPSVVISIVSIPSHGMAYRLVQTNLALSIITVTILALSLVPPVVTGILDDVTLVLAVLGGFPLPALAHITIHYFRRPLSIIVSHEPSSVPPSPSNSDFLPSPSRDPLLQRKERLLQRSRFSKRIFWDIGIWIILIPMCACAFVWAAGRLAHQW